MEDLKAKIEAVLAGADVSYSKPKKKLKDKKDPMFEDDDDEIERVGKTDDDDDENYESPKQEDVEKDGPSGKQDVALIRMLLNNKFSKRLKELRGK